MTDLTPWLTSLESPGPWLYYSHIFLFTPLDFIAWHAAKSIDFVVRRSWTWILVLLLPSIVALGMPCKPSECVVTWKTYYILFASRLWVVSEILYEKGPAWVALDKWQLLSLFLVFCPSFQFVFGNSPQWLVLSPGHWHFKYWHLGNPAPGWI